MSNDKLHRFLFDQANIRGEIAQLTETWKTILSHHDYPQVIRDHLGQVVAASILLSATLKFEGSLTIQANGDGALTLMVVECRNDFAVRAIAKYHQTLPLPGTDESGLKQLLGNGTLAITIEQAVTGERYQGIVALEGSSVAQFLEGYLQRSEQLETRIYLAADEYAAGGLLLQQLPGQQNEDDDSWERITQLGNTIKDDELLSLTAREILHRLYHEDDIRLFNPEEIYFECSCSRNKVSNMLHSISQNEAADILREQGNISVDCEFCGQTYEFDEIDIAEIYTDQLNLTGTPTKH